MTIAKIFILIGLVLTGLGILLYVFPKLFSWFGQLPGDIRFVRENGKIFIPVTSMLLLSVLGTALINFLIWIVSKFR